MPSKTPPLGPLLQAVPNQSMQAAQRLIMSAHMQQAILLLQLPLQELESFIESQVVQNPLLEIGDSETEEQSEEEEKKRKENENDEREVEIDEKDLSILNRLDEEFRDHFDQTEQAPQKRSAEEEKLKTFLEQSYSKGPSLQEQLIQQSHESFEGPQELAIAEILIGYIDAFGYLKTPLSEISKLHQLPEIEAKRILAEIQTFEPFGVGAATIQESLLIQLRCLHKEHTLAYEIVCDHYEELLHNQIPIIQKKLRRPFNQIQEAIEKDIAKLNLHPGTHFSTPSAQAIIPDVTLRLDGDRLVVEVERDFIPNLRVNARYLRMLNDPETSLETKRFLKHHYFSARWLVRNLQQRFSTIERVAEALAKKQADFFNNPMGQLTPLTMKTLSEELDLHESTIARTVSNKYLFCPRGLFTLRSFFTNKYESIEGETLSSTTVKEALMDIIAKEDKSSPLSDEKISSALMEKGIPCARRTVAKYRLVEQIGNAQQRKKFL